MYSHQIPHNLLVTMIYVCPNIGTTPPQPPQESTEVITEIFSFHTDYSKPSTNNVNVITQ